ncbi:MAG: putative permease [Sediminicola sp.]|jgi:predicted permease
MFLPNMDINLQKTLVFISFIGIGLLLKVKFNSKEELNGLKKIILNLALPATIFIALMSVEIEGKMILLPLLALALNIFLFYGFPYLLPFTGVIKDTAEYRTARLLIPSLAPGLSCFPFVMEYLGEDYLAKAAIADLGNKIFVLLILYMVAMKWYYHKRNTTAIEKGTKIKSLVMTMISEPVNIFITIALLLVFLGISFESLPFFLSETLSRLSFIMTPLVLLFIGLAVHIKKKQFSKLISLMLLRAGVVALFCGMIASIAKITPSNDLLLLLSFGLSACSFWPFAHISAVDSLEKKIAIGKKTFNPNFGINILALSFPFSTIIILVILSSGNTFASIGAIFLLGIGLLFFGFAPFLYKIARITRRRAIKEKIEWIQYKTAKSESV